MAATTPAWRKPGCWTRAAPKGSSMVTVRGSTMARRAPRVAMNACRSKLSRTRDCRSSVIGSPSRARAAAHPGSHRLGEALGLLEERLMAAALEDLQAGVGKGRGQPRPEGVRD